MALASFPTPFWISLSLYLLLLLIILASTSVMQAQAQQQVHEEDQSSSSSCNCQIPCLSRRSIYSTIWAGLLTTAALALDSWADSLHLVEKNRLISTLLLLFMPFRRIHIVISRAGEVWKMSKSLEHRDISTLAKRWGNLLGGDKVKQQLKILISCKVYISMPLDMNMNESQKQCMGKVGKEMDISEKNIRDSLEWPCAKWNLQKQHSQECQTVVKLNSIGKVECFKLPDVVPHLEELRKLRTSNGLGTFIASVQAAGYFAAIIERLSQKLDIAPIEGIAFIFSILVLFQAALYWGTVSSCQRALIIHLNKEEAKRILDNMNYSNLLEKEKKMECNKKLLGMFGALFLLVVGGPIISYGVRFMLSNPRCVLCSLTSLLFLLSVTLHYITFTCKSIMGNNANTKLRRFVESVSMIMYVSSYAVGIVSTVLDWNRFNVEGKPITHWISPRFS